MRYTMMLAALVSAFGCAGLAAAAETVPGSCGVCETAESDHYLTQAGGKIGRGVVNTGLGWSEVTVRHEVPEDRTKPEQRIASVDMGIRRTMKRTIVGLGEAFTFWAGPRKLRWAEDCSLGVWGVTGR